MTEKVKNVKLVNGETRVKKTHIFVHIKTEEEYNKEDIKQGIKG